jgi:hypothetical protein
VSIKKASAIEIDPLLNVSITGESGTEHKKNNNLEMLTSKAHLIFAGVRINQRWY